jgi:hypothetical protein
MIEGCDNNIVIPAEVYNSIHVCPPETKMTELGKRIIRWMCENKEDWQDDLETIEYSCNSHEEAKELYVDCLCLLDLEIKTTRKMGTVIEWEEKEHLFSCIQTDGSSIILFPVVDTCKIILDGQFAEWLDENKLWDDLLKKDEDEEKWCEDDE